MPTSRRRQVDFAATRRYRTQRLRLAYDRFRQFGGDESEALHAFRRRERYWLDDYAMFVALHDRYRGAWVKWPRELRLRHRRSLRRAEQELAYQVGFVRFTQFVFDRQWRELRDYARRRGVRLIGDVPHFVAHDSVDVWANRSLFRLCQFRKTHHRSCATIASTCGGAGGQ